MKPLYLLILLLLIISGTITAQEKVIKGKVVERKTGLPVVAANLILPDGTGAYSMENGRFTLKVAEFPTVIRVSHISYIKTAISLDKPPKGDLVIELDEQVGEIREVEISARKLRILTEHEDFSIQDYVFDNDNLWLLGYTNNQAGKGRLWLASWFGDTISSVPVSRAESLYRDAFGVAYLVLKDSVYQLYAEKNQVYLPYSMAREDFTRLMEPIQSGFASKLVYLDVNTLEARGSVYYRDAYLPGRQLLTIIEDHEEHLKNLAVALGKVQTMWTELAGNYPVKKGSKVEALIKNPIKVPLFSWRDTLFVINLFKDSLLSFGPDGRFKRSVHFTYCKDVMLGGIDGGVRYKSLTALPDPVGSGLYLLERRNYNWYLLPLDAGTGKVGQPVELPQFPDMFRISVFGNAAYFLYPEKKYPFYVRLYRYQL